MAIIRLTEKTTDNEYDIDTDGTRHNFRVGDTVTYHLPGTHWENKRIYIKGTSDILHGNLLAGRVTGEREFHFLIEAHQLVLLERPSWPFKVGDRVTVAEHPNNIINIIATGEVVVLDPSSKGVALIQLDQESCERLPSVRDYFRFPWFPDKYKVENNKLIWVHWDWLRLANAATAPVTATMAEDRTEKPAVNDVIEVSDKPTLPPAPIILNARKLWDECKTRVATGALPVFNPLMMKLEDALIVDLGEPEAARNMENCLYKLGATLFHLLHNESEFNDEKYDAEPEATYGALLKKEPIDELISFLLFGKPQSPEEVETRFTWLNAALETLEINPLKAQPTPIGKAEPDIFQQALQKLIAAGLDEFYADRIVRERDLAGCIIDRIREIPN